MHLQIRALPVASPPDLVRFLGVLNDAKISLQAAGGGNIELGGEFVCVPEDGKEEDAVRVLSADYAPRVVKVGDPGLRCCWLVPDKAGELLACISDTASVNLDEGRVIADIVVGTVPDDQGRLPVHVYSVEVKTAANQLGRSQA